MTLLFPALLAAALAQAAPAAERPADFSGLWTLDAARSETVRNNRRIDHQLSISQDGSNFRVTPVAAPGVETVTAEIEGPTPADAGARRSKGYWEGPALVTQQDLQVNGMAVTIKRGHSLTSTGEMVVETQVMMHHGYKPGEGLPTGVAQDIYVRAR